MRYVPRQKNFLIYFPLWIPFLSCLAVAQVFDSGSDGSDGALVFEGTGTVLFDPSTFDPPLDPDGDNIYHFTSITIPSGLTVRMLAPQLNWSPVYWLASGRVNVSGTINLVGEPGLDINVSTENHRPSIPGPGGFPGGIGQNNINPPTAGLGPGGGSPAPASTSAGGSAAHATVAGGGLQENTYGNVYLRPLLGGSGGGGGGNFQKSVGHGGGAGGGCLVIASSESVSVGGAILSRGGRNVDPTLNAGIGSGGAVWILAPVIAGAGSLHTTGSNTSFGIGRVRMEAFQNLFNGSIIGVFRRVTLVPNTPFLPTSGFPQVRVTTINGNPVSSSPTGSFSVPDATIDSASSVVVGIEAAYVPVGSIVDLIVYSESVSIQTTVSTPLVGSFDQSTATANLLFPPGFSRGWAHATWE